MSEAPVERTEVAVVGGGPAGAATALRLARAGVSMTVLEAAPEPRWRACGVFTSPATVTALRGLGPAPTDLRDVAEPIPAMCVESGAGARFRLTYDGTGSLEDSAVGLARPAFDELLLVAAGAAGVEVRRGARVVDLDRVAHDGWRLELAGGRRVDADVVIGADGLRSIVARSMGVLRDPPIGRRIGLTFHIRDPDGVRPHDARIVVFRDGYVGLAPVPGGRLNVGIVLGRSWFGRLRSQGSAAVASDILRFQAVLGDRGSAAHVEVLDRVAGASPLAHAVNRRAGPGWLLVGDAAGFLDPFTGEGLHRSLASAQLAASTILDARADARRTPQLRLADAAARYDAAMRRGFGDRDLVTRIVDGFVTRPALFEYVARRLAAREATRATMGRVIGDLVPAGRALDPRFLAAVLRP